MAWHLRVYQNKTGCGTQMTVPVCWRSRTHGDKSKEWEAIMMKYAVLSGNERFEIREGELKSNGCAVLQVTHVGVCGTDTSYWHEGERYRGVVIGHEYSGVVVAPGTNRALKPGDRVAGYTQNVFQEPCGHCEACLAGDWDHCTNRRVFTWKGGELGHPGAYSQYTTWFPHSLVKLPDNVTNEEGAMAEPFAVGLHAIQVSQVKPNDRVLILGGGIIGMSCAEWARTFGASEITVSELNPQKREIIRGYQVADHVVAADAPDLEQQLLDISGGGYDLLIDCVGVPSAFNTGLRALKPEFYMRATAVGLPHAQFPLDYERLVLKQVLLRGSKGHNFDEFKTVINAMASGRISVKKYISRRIKLEEVQAGFEAMKAARGLDTKVIIETQ